MDEKTKNMIETLKNNSRMVQSLFRSQDGRELLRQLTKGDNGTALQHAAQQASQGDTSQMVQMISRVMQSRQGAELVERINQTLKK